MNQDDILSAQYMHKQMIGIRSEEVRRRLKEAEEKAEWRKANGIAEPEPTPFPESSLQSLKIALRGTPEIKNCPNCGHSLK